MNDWQTKVILGLIPAFLAMGGWAITLEGRVQVIDARQQERGPVIAEIKADHKELNKRVDEIASDPNPRPSAKIILDEHARRIDKLEARLSSLHEYIIALPVRPQQPPQFKERRGEIDSPVFRQ